MIEIDYLEKSFGKLLVANSDLNSRMICEFAQKDSTIDGSSRYTFANVNSKAILI